jgi:hypothetical protein
MPEIAFANRLTEADWDETLRGWRCPALAVPGAVVDALFVDGNRTDSARYEVLPEHSIIRWTPIDQPQRVTASIRLTKELTLGSETDRWKKLAIVLPVVATIVSAGITAAATLWRPLPPAPSPPGSQPTPPAPMPAPTPASRPLQASNNISKSQALEVPLGQAVRGDTQEKRWFRFTVTNNDSVQVRIAIKNLYEQGGWWWSVFNSANTKIAESSSPCQQEGCTIRFTSPQPDTYYLVLAAFGTATYELTITD